MPAKYKFGANQEENVSTICSWLQNIMQPSAHRIIEIIVGPLAAGSKDLPDKEKLKKAEELFYDVVLVNMDKKLGSSRFFCSSNEFTVVDIALYNELHSVLALQDKPLDESKLPNLKKWYDDISEDMHVEECNGKLKKMLTDYGIH